jgi:hypothetical protein
MPFRGWSFGRHALGLTVAVALAGTPGCGPRDAIDREPAGLNAGVGGVLRPAPERPSTPTPATENAADPPKAPTATEPTISPAPATEKPDGGTAEAPDGGAPTTGTGDPGAETDAAPAATPDPNLNDTPATDCAGVAEWQPGGTYLGDEKFVHGTPKRLFQCRPWPYAPWCSLPSYEPGLPGSPWADAWIHKGICP